MPKTKKQRTSAQPPTVASLVKQLCDDEKRQDAARALAAMAAEDDEKAQRVATALLSTEGSVEAVAALLESDYDAAANEWPAVARDAAFIVANVCRVDAGAREAPLETDANYQHC